jgi:hypothetical protein
MTDATLTPEQIEAIRKRAEAATPGPWRAMEEGNQYLEGQTKLVSAARVDGISRPWNSWFVVPAVKMEEVCRFISADADFIAHARQDIPALLSALEAAERRAGERRLAFEKYTKEAVAEINRIEAERDSQQRLAIEAMTERDTLRARVERLERALREIQKHADKYCNAGALQGPMEYQADPRGRKKAWNMGAYDAAKPIARMTRAALTEKEPADD